MHARQSWIICQKFNVWSWGAWEIRLLVHTTGNDLSQKRIKWKITNLWNLPAATATLWIVRVTFFLLDRQAWSIKIVQNFSISSKACDDSLQHVDFSSPSFLLHLQLSHIHEHIRNFHWIVIILFAALKESHFWVLLRAAVVKCDSLVDRAAFFTILYIFLNWEKCKCVFWLSILFLFLICCCWLQR